MKVLYIANNVTKHGGGLAKNIMDFCDAIPGHIVSFVQDANVEPLISSCTENIQVYSIPVLKKYYFPSRKNILRSIEKNWQDIDLVILNGLFTYSNYWALKNCKRHKTPMILVPHGCLEKPAQVHKKLWMRLFINAIIEYASGVIFACTKEYQVANNYINSDTLAKKSLITYWPVSENILSSKHEAKKMLHEQLGIPLKQRIILYLGRIDAHKRVKKLVHLFHNAQLKNTNLVIVGNIDSKEGKEAIALKEALKAKKVFFKNSVWGKEKKVFFQGADAYVSFSKRENFSYSTVEALSYSTPVILSNGHYIIEDLAPAKCGFFIEKDNEIAFMEALYSFESTSDDNLVNMGIEGEKWVKKSLSKQTFRTNIESFIKQTLLLSAKDK